MILTTVVVADPSSIARQLYALCFARFGLAVATAADSEHALSALRRADGLALLVADASVPPNGALKLYEQCATLNPVPQLVVTTRAYNAEEADRVKRAGGAAYLTKPIHSIEFSRVVRRIRGDLSRAAPRVRCGTRVNAIVTDPTTHSRLLRWEISDISISGALLATNAVLPIGQRVTADLVIDGEPYPILGEIVRIQPPRETAIRFVDLIKPAHDAIAALVAAEG